MEHNNHIAFRVYNASAGSGKTYTLAKEYLKIVLQAPEHDAYKNILAITFTNKAVDEMKSRIVEYLYEFTKDKPSSKAKYLLEDISKEIGKNVSEIQDKSKKIIQKIIHNYASFDISTIDKFTHRIIRSFAFELGKSMNFEVDLEVERLLEEAVEDVIQKVGQETTDKEDKYLSELLIDFVKEKAQNNKSWNITQEIFETSKLLVKEGDKENVLRIDNKSITDYIELKQLLREIIEQEQSEVLTIAHTALKIIEDNQVTDAFKRNTVPDRFRKVIKENGVLGGDILREKEEVIYRNLDKDFEGFGGYSSKQTPIDQQQTIENIAPELLNLVKRMYKHARKATLYESIYKNINPLSVLSTINRAFQRIQEEQNVLSISEFNSILNQQIKDQPAPFVYEKLGDKYVHFFIDEFQDTSQMQWENLKPLIENALSGEVKTDQPGSLMIVGDPKQSIYAWRGGKVEQFIKLSDKENAQTNPFPNCSRKVWSLDTNYRSYSQIIEFNNKFFKFLADTFTEPYYKKIYQEAGQKTTDKIGGYVEFTFLQKEHQETDSDDNEALDVVEKYASKTLEIIQNAKDKGYAYSDIAILVRTKNSGVLLADYLIEREIPVVSSETLLLSNSDNVKLLIHLLYFIKDENNQQSKARFLYYLGRLVAQADIHNFVKKGIAQQQIVSFEQWLSDLGYSLNIKELQSMSLFEAIQQLIDMFFYQKSDTYLQSFQDLVLEQNMKIQLSLPDFLEYWEKDGYKKSIPSPKGNAVQIMTIHKSKGLEFPVVIIPFANYKYKKINTKWFDIKDDKIDLEKIYITPNSKVNSIEWIREQVDKIEQEELLSNINVLYVALTRATEQLYVVTDNNFAKDYMACFYKDYLENEKLFNEEQLVYSFGENKRCSVADKELQKIEFIEDVSEKLNLKQIKIAVNEALMWNTKQKESIEYGNVLHQLLSQIDCISEVDQVIQKAVAKGDIDLNIKQEVKAVIGQIVSLPELSCFFAQENKVFKERNIIGKNQLYKPDRIVIDAQQRVSILDYKTGLEDAKHIAQIQRYADVITQMGLQVIRKTIVYIGNEIKLIEVE
ncbi:MAG: UvrD-helicase domain-containing protein [Bacteroidota bacterium]|nr:UvrD-helicase domain-containing protein [Bacteroidota bacterium]